MGFLLDDPKQTGLLSLGLRLMSTPGRFTSALGQAGMGALGDYQAAAQQQRQNKRADLQESVMLMQLAEAQRKAQAQREAENKRAGFLDSINPNAGPAMPFSPAAAFAAGLGADEIKALTPQERKLHNLSPGGRLVSDAGELVAEAPFKPATPSLNDLIVPGPDGKPMVNQALLDAKKQIAASAPGVSVSYGSPVAGQDPQGNPVFFQPSKDGRPPAIVSGVTPPKKDMALTEAQAKAATFKSQMEAAERELANVKINPTQLANQIDVQLAGGVTNIVASPQAQRARQAQEQWSEAFLRFKTGAAATKDEVILNVRTFFPQPGDSSQVIEQKSRMRQQAAQDIAFAAGQKSDSGKTTDNDPLGIRPRKP